VVIGSTDDQPVYIKKNDTNKIWVASDGVIALGGDNTYTGITSPVIVLAGETYLDASTVFGGFAGYQATPLRIVSSNAQLQLGAAAGFTTNAQLTIDQWNRAIVVKYSDDLASYDVESRGNLVVFNGFNSNIPADLGSVYAASFTGSLNGNADTATTAETASYVDADNVVGTVASANSSSHALIADVALSYMEQPKFKSGKVAGGDFTGNPKTYTVTFTTPFDDGNYSVMLNGGNARSWTAESVVSGSFVISANSNVTMDEDVYWLAMEHGESD